MGSSASISLEFHLEIDLKDSCVVPHGFASFFSRAVGLVLACWRLLWCNQASVAPRQGLAHGHNGRFPIALQNKSVLSTPGVAPGLKPRVHVFHQPTFITISS